MELEYIITETKGPDSFDPISADKTQNISVMRMLYSTPLEINRDNSLSSSILSSFQYDRDNKEILFVLKDNVTYEDGQLITTQDVALAIARMAYFRPSFPVIKDIQGIGIWSSQKNGISELPDGIKISGNSIRIKLTRDYANPLFRFCLELFSIIPANCINSRTGEMTCERAPSSGYFSIEKIEESKIVFAKRLKGITPAEPIPYKKITFSFSSLQKACQIPISINSIVTGNELDYLSSGCDHEKMKSELHWLPASRFGVVRFNPNVSIFKSSLNRRIFAEEVRRSIKKSNSKVLVEKGIFSILLPGYLSDDRFPTLSRPTTSDFVGQAITLPRVKQSGLKVIADSIIEAAKSLGMLVTEVNAPSNEDLITGFLTGKIPTIAGASGFWAQDPIGDVSMWFTPNLHKTMTFLWKDDELYRQIDSLESELDPSKIKSKMESLNLHIYEEALVAPVAHFRRFYISSNLISNLNLPQAVTSPAPWQLVPQD